MPRTEPTGAARVLRHFRTAALPEAELLFGLVRDTMQERRQRSAAGKAVAAKGASKSAHKATAPKKDAHAVAADSAKPTKAKAKAKKRAKKKPTTPALPLGPVETDNEAAARAADEAPDAPDYT